MKTSKETTDQVCESCIKAKFTINSSKQAQQRASSKLELIHSDLSGIMKPSISKNRYFLLFIDDLTRFTWVYLLRTKTKEVTLSAFKEFKALVEKQTPFHKIKRLRSDNGKGEYSNLEFQQFLKNEGIQHEPCPPYTQSMNGVSERKMRTVNEAARSMLNDAKLPDEFWDEAVQTA